MLVDVEVKTTFFEALVGVVDANVSDLSQVPHQEPSKATHASRLRQLSIRPLASCYVEGLRLELLFGVQIGKILATLTGSFVHQIQFLL